jgi:hypothetical protein
MINAVYDTRDDAIVNAVKLACGLQKLMCFFRLEDENSVWQVAAYEDFKKEVCTENGFRLVTPDGHLWRLS